MSIGFILTGAVIFAIYMGFTIWNILYSSRKQQEENYPNLNLNDPVSNKIKSDEDQKTDV